ncbi:MAG: hypothetical protein EOO50_13600 [Flavobacterium sp.]|uniref:hypothetical protein n=1 Tax=Flavobacterium sp. TaxID=239 RepID=UPI00121CC84B|nr:hypothetical protein [Flavobacterium sp.]RZJ65493.1 MAG: hypothetical protein EOO50_13600 [Flavobacterium sp.]
MKKFILLALFATASLAAQEKDSLETNKGFRVHVRMRFHVAYPIAFGDNFYGEGHDPIIGFGLNGSLLQVSNLRFGLGFEYAVFDVKDQAMIGTFENSTFKMYYVFGEYDKRISQKVTLTPGIGVGYASNRHGSWTEDYGRQNGYAVRAGLNTSLQVSKHGYFYLGVHYIYGNFTVDTEDAFEDYYSKTNQIQLSLGFQID